MQQTSNLPVKFQPNAMDMGLVSISEALSQISQNTVAGSKFLDSITSNFDELKVFIGE